MKLTYIAKMKYESEDGGTVLIAESLPGRGEMGGTWIRFISSDESEEHRIFRELEGKLVSITVEDIENELG